jgi:hypothetical protein
MSRKSGLPPKAHDAREHFFCPDSFAAVRVEEIDAVANLSANLIAVYHPVNSEELFAIERLALARHSLLRAYRIESGLVTLGLEEALDVSGSPRILQNPELTNGLQVTAGQNHNYWTAAGFSQLSRKSDWQFFLRYQAQAERLYRRALEEFERIRALRGILPEQNLAQPEPTAVIAPQVAPLPAVDNIQPAAQNPAPTGPGHARHNSRSRRPERVHRVPREAGVIPNSREAERFGHPNPP